MKKASKSILIFIGISIFLFPSFFKPVSASTIGDSTFSVKPGIDFIWIVTSSSYGAPYQVGDKCNLSIEEINGQGGNININATLKYYNNSQGAWITELDKNIFVSFNETLDTITYCAKVFNNAIWGWVFIIPTPLNLTLIGEFINSTYPFESMSINGNELSLVAQPGAKPTYKYTYNNNGTLTAFKIIIDGDIIFELVKGTSYGLSNIGDDDDDDDDEEDEFILIIIIFSILISSSLIAGVMGYMMYKKKKLALKVRKNVTN